MVAFSLFADIASFAGIAHRVSDHLLCACNVFDGFLQLINGRRLSTAHVNQGVVTVEIITQNQAEQANDASLGLLSTFSTLRTFSTLS